MRRAAWFGGAPGSSGGGTRTHNLTVNSRSLCLIELPRTVSYPGHRQLRRVMLVAENADASFDFHVAVRAEKHAFGCLLTQGFHRSGEPPAAEPEALALWITVMKLQGG